MTATRARTHRPGAAPPAREWSEFLFVPDILFALATVLAVWVLPPERGLAAISLIACVFAATAALRRGGPYLLPSSVFFLAAGVFVGIAAYYLGRVDHDVDPYDVRNAAALALLSTIGIAMVVLLCSVQWRLKWNHMGGGRVGARRYQPPRQFVFRAVALIVASQLPPLEALLGPVAQAIGLTGIVMLTLVASSRRIRIRWAGDLLLVAVVVAAPVTWFYIEFSGGGRLIIAGLLVAAFMGWNLVHPRRIQKIAAILAIPVFLLYAGWDRLDRRSGADGVSSSSIVADGRGLGSLYSPLRTFGEVIEPKSPEAMARLGPRHGETFYNTLVLPVPRSLWESKPEGFGRELVGALEIRGVSQNHSVAALLHGEWYANFGYPGLAMMLPVVGWFLALLDRSHSRVIGSGMATSRDWWRAVILLCLVTSLADLFWVGTFTFYARGGLAALVALIMARMSQRRIRVARRLRRGATEGSPNSVAVPGSEGGVVAR